MSSHPIPTAALDDRLGVVGTSGSGKTYGASGAVERLLARKSRVVWIDPLGVAWGIRLMADGKTPSPYEVVIFGGPHGDMPITEHAGAIIGETVASMKESAIIDLSELGTKAAERRFMLAFLTALYKHASGEQLHIIFDEADMWAPQQIRDRDQEPQKLLGMMETIVRRGRIKGFVPWLIAQRPAVVNKDVLSQVDGLVAFKLTSSQDRGALKAWVEGQADAGEWPRIYAELPTKQVGEAIVWLPGHGKLETTKFPPKATFDSSRAPKKGEKRATAELAPLDLGKLKERLSTVEQEAKANDPKALKVRILDLERQVAGRGSAGGTGNRLPHPKNAGAPPLPDSRPEIRELKTLVATLRKGLGAAMKLILEINASGFFKAGGDAIDKGALEKAITEAAQQATKLVERQLNARNAELQRLLKKSEQMAEQLKGLLGEDVTVAVAVNHNEPFTVTPAAPRQPRVKAAAGNGADTTGDTTGPQRQLLKSLAWWAAMGHDQPTRTQVAAIAGWRPKGSNLRNRLSELSARGLIEYPSDGRVRLTPAGTAAAPEPDTAQTLIASIRGMLTGPQRVVFERLLEAGTEITRDELAAAIGWEPGGSNLRNRLSELSALEVVEYPSRGGVMLQGWVLG